jgi:Alkylmercury lyase
MRTLDFDARVRSAVYRHFAETGQPPSLATAAALVGAGTERVRRAYQRLRERRLLVLEPDGASVRMAPPFSGVPTGHVVESDDVTYYANCAWDALGVPAALRRAAVVHSRCGQTGEPLDLRVGRDGPEPCDWLFHCPVPAARWWADIVFT